MGVYIHGLLTFTVHATRRDAQDTIPCGHATIARAVDDAHRRRGLVDYGCLLGGTDAQVIDRAELLRSNSTGKLSQVAKQSFT